jgi:hypothetical protein
MKRSRSSGRRTGGKRGGTLRLGLIFALLVGINVYVLFFGSGSMSKVSAGAKEAAKGGESLLPRPVIPSGGPVVVIQGKVRAGESLGSILTREGIVGLDSDEVIHAMQPIMSFGAIEAGQAYTVARSRDGRVESFELSLGKGNVRRVVRGRDGRLSEDR